MTRKTQDCQAEPRALSFAPVSAAMETPCQNICAVDGRLGLCIGCGRTLAEIANWQRFSDTERRIIMAQLAARLGNKSAASPSD